MGRGFKKPVQMLRDGLLAGCRQRSWSVGRLALSEKSRFMGKREKVMVVLLNILPFRPRMRGDE